MHSFRTVVTGLLKMFMKLAIYFLLTLTLLLSLKWWNFVVYLLFFAKVTVQTRRTFFSDLSFVCEKQVVLAPPVVWVSFPSHEQFIQTFLTILFFMHSIVRWKWFIWLLILIKKNVKILLLSWISSWRSFFEETITIRYTVWYSYLLWKINFWILFFWGVWLTPESFCFCFATYDVHHYKTYLGQYHIKTR